MRVPVLIIIGVALLAALVVVIVGLTTLVQPNLPLIVDAGFELGTITPNADGESDITPYYYELSDNARVSILFVGENATFAFREEASRAKGEYSGLFSGVVDGFLLPDETLDGEVQRRLIPDGVYQWQLIAVTDSGEQDSREGQLIIADADTPLPEITTFDVSPEFFTPNQDGIRDRAQINVYLEKDADLNVFLEGENGVRIPIPQRVEETRDGEAGRYVYDYEGGVDRGGDPPPDGTYTVLAVAQDAVGQRIQRSTQLTIADGGKPLAEITNQPVGPDVLFTVMPFDDAFSTTADRSGELIDRPSDPQAFAVGEITMQVGDMLVFMLTVENYNDVPLRTHGAPPGTVYDQNQRASTLGYLDQSGAWRVGIDCDTATTDYPWRWRVGDESVLVTEFDAETGNTYYYLPPGERAVVWGAIRMTEVVVARNPQNCWAGLIHEDVEISLRNQRVGARSVELIDPNTPLYDTDEEAG